MAEKVGEIYYDVVLDTGRMVSGQREVDRAVGKTVSRMGEMDAALTRVASAVKSYAAALWLISQSDAYTKLTAQLKLATDGQGQFTAAMQQTRNIAREAQTDVSAVAVLYARISNATKELGVSQAGVNDITRTVALALKVSGATAQEAGSAMLQLSQAFGSGVLRGEEFNAVNEASPRLMKALADGIGVPIGQLRSMAEAGKLTSEVLAVALPKALSALEGEAQQIQTISGAFQQLKNEVMLFVGEQSSASGAARLTADAVSMLAENINVLASAAYGFAAAKLAAVLLESTKRAAENAAAVLASVAAQREAQAASVASAASKLQETAATQAAIVVAREETLAKLASANAAAAQAAAQMNAARAAGAQSFAIALLREGELAATAATHARSAAIAELAILGQQQARVTAAMTAAQAAHTTALNATGVAATVASRALGVLGGPIGAITTLLGLGATAWMLWGNSAESAEKKAAQAVERSTDDIVSDLDKQIAKLKERNLLASAGLPGIAKQDGDAAKKLATLQGQISNLMANKGPDGGAPLPEAARVDLLQKLLGQYGTLAGKIQQVESEKAKLDSVGASSRLTQWMTKYATDAERMAAEIKKAKEELGAGFTPDLEARIREKYAAKSGGGGPAGSPKVSFDAAGYLSGLAAQSADAMTRIGIVEDEALRDAKGKLDERKISQQQYNDAVTLIEAKAAQDRLDIQLKEGEDALAARYEQMAREQKAKDEIQKGRDFADKAIAGADPVTKLEAELAAELEKMTAYAAIDLEYRAKFAEAKVALEQQTADKIREIREKEEKDRLAKQSKQLQDYGNLFGSMAGLIQAFGGKQNAAYKAMFAASKAFAIADAIINIQAGIAKAANGVFPQNLGAMATVAAQTAGIVSTISSTEYGGGRQYGGPVSAGSMYRINETGKPEMFTASNGSQYMLPTKSGSVTPADQVGQSSVVINQSFTFGDGVNRSELMQYGESIKQQTLAAVYQGRTRGGAYE